MNKEKAKQEMIIVIDPKDFELVRLMLYSANIHFDISEHFKIIVSHVRDLVNSISRGDIPNDGIFYIRMMNEKQINTLIDTLSYNKYIEASPISMSPINNTKDCLSGKNIMYECIKILGFNDYMMKIISTSDSTIN